MSIDLEKFRQNHGWLVRVLIAVLVVASGFVTAAPASARMWPPLAPSSLTLTPGDGQLTADWSESSTNGNSPIDYYHLWVYPEADEDNYTNVDVHAPTLTYTATGLTNGTSFCVAIETFNTDGYHSASLTSSCATPVASGQSASPSPSPSLFPFTYTTDSDNNVTITGCVNSCPSNLVLPSSIEGHSVTQIGEEAFMSKSINSVSLPNSLTTIGAIAFSDNSLTSLVIPASVTTLGSGAFRNNLLTSLVIPESVINLGWYTFNNNRLVSVTFEGNMPSGGPSAFSGNGNSQLRAITVAYGTTGWGATYFGKTVLIGSPFSYVTDSDNNVTITGCKKSCPSEMVIPSSLEGKTVTAIQNEAFTGKSISSIILPDSITTIGNFAFTSNNLHSLVIPSSVASMGAAAFAANKLTSVTFEGNAIPENDSVFLLNSNLAFVNVKYGTGWGSTWSGIPVHVLPVLPGAPSVSSFTAGNGSAIVTFTAPASDGGTDITNYVVEFKRSSSGDWTTVSHDVSASTMAYPITGLSNGTSYDVRVTAVNAVGAGAASDTASVKVGVGNPASEPLVSGATTGNAQVTISMFAPRRTGGTAIEGYQFTLDGESWSDVDPSSTSNRQVIKGLRNGTLYSMQLRAINGAGPGAVSKRFYFKTPIFKASKPQGFHAYPHDGSIGIEFEAPLNNGGSSVINYGYSINGGSWKRFSPASNLSIVRLTNGTGYSVRVAAFTTAGWGEPSDAIEVTPHN